MTDDEPRSTALADAADGTSDQAEAVEAMQRLCDLREQDRLLRDRRR
jgi:hypothetical protein